MDTKPGSESDTETSTSSTPELVDVPPLLEITFNVMPESDDEDAASTVSEDSQRSEFDHYIELGGSFQITYDKCLDLDEIVLPMEQIILREDEEIDEKGTKHVTLILDYPLDDDYEFRIYPDDERGFTRGHIIREIKRTYDKVYAEEEETSTVPVGNIPGLLNRDFTDGNYGVWGHDLSDLGLHTVSYNPARNVFWLGIDS